MTGQIDSGIGDFRAWAGGMPTGDGEFSWEEREIVWRLARGRRPVAKLRRTDARTNRRAARRRSRKLSVDR